MIAVVLVVLGFGLLVVAVFGSVVLHCVDGWILLFRWFVHVPVSHKKLALHDWASSCSDFPMALLIETNSTLIENLHIAL